MDRIEATFLSEPGRGRALVSLGPSDSGGSVLLLRACQAACKLIARARCVGHGVAIPGLVQRNCESGGEVSMPAAPS